MRLRHTKKIGGFNLSLSVKLIFNRLKAKYEYRHPIQCNHQDRSFG